MGIRDKINKKKEQEQKENIIKCPECGSEMSKELSYCKECGSSLKPEEEEKSSAAPVAEEKPKAIIYKEVEIEPAKEEKNTVPEAPKDGAEEPEKTEETDDYSLADELDVSPSALDEEQETPDETPAEDPAEALADETEDPAEALADETEDPAEALADEMEDPSETLADEVAESEEYVEEVEEEAPYSEENQEYVYDEPTEEDAEFDGICPECGTENDIDAVFCRECGYQFREAEDIEVASPIYNAPASLGLIDFVDLDLSNALPGDKIIAKKTKDGYEVLIAPTTYPIYVLDCIDIEADVLKTDYMLREVELSFREKINAYCFLNDNLKTVEALFGTANLDVIYEEDVRKLVKLKGAVDELLEAEIDLDIMTIFAALDADKQKLVAKVIKNAGITRLSAASATEIVLTAEETDEAKIRDIILQDAKMYEMINAIVESKIGDVA